MAQTKIEWAHYSWNPWWGCTKVSPGCDNCYAEAWARRFSVRWGAGQERRLASERTWNEPMKWNANAQRDGVRRRVFCASMADVFDNDGERLNAARDWLWELIEETPHLDWLLLTKRIGNAVGMLPPRWLQQPPANMWLGATIVNQEEADRDIPKLLSAPARVRFLSCEPLLEDLDLSNHIYGPDEPCESCPKDIDCDCYFSTRRELNLPAIDWIIVGGESGSQARPFTLGFAKEIVRQCKYASIPVFIKQLGARPVNREGERCPAVHDRKGAVMEEWPEELRIRQFPEITA